MVLGESCKREIYEEYLYLLISKPKIHEEGKKDNEELQRVDSI
jgi:hypothetical protein